ncbi:hypothetical protein [Delftia acidovorans]|uniref:hypothetical protein n=1 Tax=Delftia acidovorans TaxID=80866 RepID=UPI003342A63B
MNDLEKHAMSNSIREAIAQSVEAAGGPGIVGPILWPEKDRKSAIRLMKACLSPIHREYLAPDQMLQVFQLAKSRGGNVGIDCLLRETGYQSAGSTAAEDLVDLQRQFIEGVRAQTELAERIERAAGRVHMRVAA